MINWEWITSDGPDLLMVVVSGISIYIILLLLTRLVGLRSFSKMSSFDFAITVAFGSIIASTLLTKQPSLANGVLGLAVLYGIQYLISKSRRLTATVERLVDNVPLLLMAGEEVLTKHLDEARITEDDLKANLRMAGISHPKQVFAVVLETTGDISVLKAGDKVDLWIFDDIRGADKLSSYINHVQQV